MHQPGSCSPFSSSPPPALMLVLTTIVHLRAFRVEMVRWSTSCFLVASNPTTGSPSIIRRAGVRNQAPRNAEGSSRSGPFVLEKIPLHIVWGRNRRSKHAHNLVCITPESAALGALTRRIILFLFACHISVVTMSPGNTAEVNRTSNPLISVKS